MRLSLALRPYGFALSRPLTTATGSWQQRDGWLLRIVCPQTGCVGWGEVAPLHPQERKACEQALADWQKTAELGINRDQLELVLPQLPPAVAFAVGAALAELEADLGPWHPAPPAAHLLPAGSSMLPELERLLASPVAAPGITVKWKVAAADPELEWLLLHQLLERLPATARLRLDANAGWDRAEADRWVEVLAADPRLQWLEQPLAVDDLDGLNRLAERLPVALDESLQVHPAWREQWQGWQVRRPLLEGDPRALLRQLQQGRPRLMLSTAFETGIGFRWLALLSRLQWQGPTPAAPGLAPGWCPDGPLFSAEPEQVWAAAGGAC